MLVVLLSVMSGCGGAPQLGNEECLKAADALWTALTSKRADLLDSTAGDIEKLHNAAKLPTAAFDSLSYIIETARAGKWADARASLKVLIRAQRPMPAQTSDAR